MNLPIPAEVVTHVHGLWNELKKQPAPVVELPVEVLEDVAGGAGNAAIDF
jgi:hypothetical protein